MKPLHKEILSLAVPSILANITVPLVGMADIAVAGHLGGGTGAAALIGGIMGSLHRPTGGSLPAPVGWTRSKAY